MTIGTLHDAEFEDLLVRWRDGVAIMSLRTAEGRRRLVISGVTQVHLPRQLPWGPSVHINNFTRSDSSSGSRFEFELQSGDTLVNEGTSIAAADEAGGDISRGS